MLPANDNIPATFEDYVASLPTEIKRGCCINVVATDSPAHVMRNVAIYYRQKEEAWADSMAQRLLGAVGGAA